MRKLYEDFKETLLDHKQDILNQQARFSQEVKGLTKAARQYKLQLDGYEEEIDRNIAKINIKIKSCKED